MTQKRTDLNISKEQIDVILKYQKNPYSFETLITKKFGNSVGLLLGVNFPVGVKVICCYKKLKPKIPNYEKINKIKDNRNKKPCPYCNRLSFKGNKLYFCETCKKFWNVEQ